MLRWIFQGEHVDHHIPQSTLPLFGPKDVNPMVSGCLILGGRDYLLRKVGVSRSQGKYMCHGQYMVYEVCSSYRKVGFLFIKETKITPCLWGG